MKTIMTILVAGAILILSSCASSKPCPAYAKTSDVEVRG